MTSCKGEKSGAVIGAIPENKSKFEKIVFTDPNSGKTVVLVSETECEIQPQEGEIILGEYSREEDKLRIVLRAFGKVMYAKLVDGGLQMTDSGKVYLLPDALRQYQEQQRMDQLAAQQEVERIKKEAPKFLIGMWKEADENDSNLTPIIRLFRADGTWTTANQQLTTRLDQGFWSVENTALLMKRDGFGAIPYQFQILEITPNKYSLQKPGQKIIGIRIEEPNLVGKANVNDKSAAMTISGNGTESSISPPANASQLDSSCGLFSQRLISANDISGWDFHQLRYAINFLYAKYGYVFPAREIQAVFTSKPWYHPISGLSMDDIDAKMSSIEASNVKVLAETKNRLKGSTK